VSTSIGISIDRVGGRDFGVTGRGGIGSNLTMDKDEDQAETVLGDAEEAERDTD